MDEHIKKVADNLDFSPLKNINGNIYLNDKEMTILRNYEINYENCMNIEELIYKIEFALDEVDYEEDLEDVASTISERNYYMNSKK